MTIPIEVLEAELLSLSPADRSRLVDRLLVSLNHDPAWEEAWGDEADRREARLTADPQQWVPVEQALAQARARLK
jgi:putative addiction module component (TIGR02574 family)